MSRASVITLSVLLLVGLVAAVTIGVLNYVSNNDKRPATSAKAVQEMCQPTDYKEACFKSMRGVSSDDPKELVKAAFESTKAEISEVANKSRTLKELEKDPKTAEAVRDCKELFQDAIDDLQRSFVQIGDLDINKVNMVLENVKVWLSATMTYQETCLDGFDNTPGDASEKVRKILQTSMQMSSNGLAIVNEMANLLGTIDFSSFNRRRLLADNREVLGHDYNHYIPDWLKNRRLLSSADDNVGGNSDNTLLEDDEPDRRRRRLLRSTNQVEGHDDYFNDIPMWLSIPQRRLLQATNLAENLKAKANVVVAQDGSGKYKTIEAAINGSIPKYGNESFIIYIKEGVYNEYLVLYKWMTNVVFIGDGPTKTRITNNKNFADGVKTFKTATLSVLGDFFMAKDIGIENSAGAIKHQAVALRVQSDKSIFFNCHMDGYQDTLYTHTYRQFYRDCRVTGTIDFIFGDAAAFFQNCTFVVRKPLDNQRCIVTAQGRMERHQPTGIFIHRCRFEADPEYYPVRKTNTAYLGRPWKEYSKTIIMESYIDDSIAPDGWLPWEGTFALETCYYGEYHNVGPGCDMSHRVKWRGIKTIVHARAEKFMPPQLYDNDDWIRASGIPYDPTLSALAPGPEGYDEDSNAPEGAPFLLPSSGSSFGTSSSSSSSSSGQSSSSSDHSTSSSNDHSSTSGGSSSSDSNPSQGSSLSSSTSSTSQGSDDDSQDGSTARSSTTNPSTFGSSTGEGQNDQTEGQNGSSSQGLFSYITSPITSLFSTQSPTPTPDSPTTTNPTSSSSSTTTTNPTSSSTTATTNPTSSSTATTNPTSTNQTSTNPTSSSTSTTSSTPSSTATTSSTPSSTATASSTSSITSTISPAPSPTSTTGPILSPTSTISPTPTPSSSQTPTPTANESLSPTSLAMSSPSSAPTEEEKKKSTGPVTIRELERILMTNEEMGEEDHANDDMSGNVPDGDEPSPAMVPTPAPSIIELSPMSSVIPNMSPSPSPSPSDDVSDWLPPATAPGPDAEAADKEPPAYAPPPKSNNTSRLTSKLHDLYLIISGFIMCFFLAM